MRMIIETHDTHYERTTFWQLTSFITIFEGVQEPAIVPKESVWRRSPQPPPHIY